MGKSSPTLLSINTKVRLRINQPTLMCSGRDTVTCYYRGTVIAIKADENLVQIAFRHKSAMLEEWYNIKTNCFVLPELQDIKLI